MGQKYKRERETHTYTQDGIKIKARLGAKGFQEENSGYVRSDSLTCSKESLRITLTIIVVLR